MITDEMVEAEHIVKEQEADMGLWKIMFTSRLEKRLQAELLRLHGAVKAAALHKPAEPEGTGAIADVATERQRQISVEGWMPEHDDYHGLGELAGAGAAYALADDFPYKAADIWPWDVGADGKVWWKPTDRRRNMVKAAALIVAEIERLDRALAPQKG